MLVPPVGVKNLDWNLSFSISYLLTMPFGIFGIMPLMLFPYLFISPVFKFLSVNRIQNMYGCYRIHSYVSFFSNVH